MNHGTQVLENIRIRPPKGSSRRILLLVHGRGGRHELMRWLSKKWNFPETEVCLLQAPHPEFVPEMRVPGFSWYLRPNEQGLEESREKLEAFIQSLIQEGFSSDQIFWLGFSQGGVMGIDTALRSSHRLGGVMSISGFALRTQDYPAAFGPQALRQRILATHGHRDQIVAFEEAKKSYEALQSLGVSVEFLEFNKPHSFDLKNELPLLEERMRSWMSLA